MFWRLQKLRIMLAVTTAGAWLCHRYADELSGAFHNSVLSRARSTQGVDRASRSRPLAPGGAPSGLADPIRVRQEFDKVQAEIVRPSQAQIKSPPRPDPLEAARKQLDTMRSEQTKRLADRHRTTATGSRHNQTPWTGQATPAEVQAPPPYGRTSGSYSGSGTSGHVQSSQTPR
jgi:hypothetical protein